MHLITFIRKAFKTVLHRYRICHMERQHAAGYARHPIQFGEFDGWEGVQDWGDE